MIREDGGDERSEQGKAEPEHDSQMVEILGRNRLKTALIEAGLDVATPERDNGIDLIAYRWSKERGEFIARPIQMKAASGFIFGIDRKYERIPGLLMAYVMNCRSNDHAIFAMSYRDAVNVGDSLGWTKTASWAAGKYVQTRSSERLVKELDRHRMTPERWASLFELSTQRV